MLEGKDGQQARETFFIFCIKLTAFENDKNSENGRKK